MKLYDEIIEKLQQLVSDKEPEQKTRSFDVRESEWPVAEREATWHMSSEGEAFRQ